MNGHTPGPWEIIVPARSGHVHRVTSRGREFALVGCPRANDDEQAANARLIAAAPDLLAALERMLTAFPAPKIRAAGGFDGNLAHAEARAAIAKAVRS